MIMIKFIPGTTIKYTEQARESAFSLISPVLEATGGLTLSQLSKLTGLEGSTIQNWIKRGWVSSTKGKKYSEKQVLRILLINMLRRAMKLESIANLMTYINGDVEDTSDDIIDDIALYNVLCRMIFNAEDKKAFEPQDINAIISDELKKSQADIRSDADKLHKAAFVAVMAYRSAYIKSEMEKVLEEIVSSL